MITGTPLVGLGRRRTFLDWRDEKIVALGRDPPPREKSRSRSRERSRRDRSRTARDGAGATGWPSDATTARGGTGPGPVAPGPAVTGVLC